MAQPSLLSLCTRTIGAQIGIGELRALGADDLLAAVRERSRRLRATTGDIRGGRAFLGIVTFMGSRHFIADIAAGALKG